MVLLGLEKTLVGEEIPVSLRLVADMERTLARSDTLDVEVAVEATAVCFCVFQNGILAI
jgi:hypothetical protein